MMQSICETCQNMREVRAKENRYLLCELAKLEPVYPKYPPQPILRCQGYSAIDARNEKK